MIVYELSKRDSKRITCMRAICMIMIIFLHQYIEKTDAIDVTFQMNANQILETIKYIISRIITFSAVPLFYLISSVLLYSKEFTWSGNTKRKLKTLIMPYILWITLYILMYFLGQTMPITRDFFANTGRIVTNMNFIDFVGAYCGYMGDGLFVNALWFLRDLILLNLLAIILKRIIDRFPRFMMLIIILLWLLGGTSLTVIFNTQSFCFFALGYYIVKYKIKLEKVDVIPIAEIVLAYLLTIVIEYYFYIISSPLRNAAHGIMVMIGILLLVRLSGVICKTDYSNIPSILYIVATYSFFIYASHDMIQTILKKVFSKVLPQTVIIQSIQYITIPIMTCFICIIVAVVIKNIAPSLYSLLTGSRERKK